jgi:hypothetical protein
MNIMRLKEILTSPMIDCGVMNMVGSISTRPEESGQVQSEKTTDHKCDRTQPFAFLASVPSRVERVGWDSIHGRALHGG